MKPESFTPPTSPAPPSHPAHSTTATTATLHTQTLKQSRPRALLWFVAIWLSSVAALGVVAWLLRWLIRS